MHIYQVCKKNHNYKKSFFAIELRFQKNSKRKCQLMCVSIHHVWMIIDLTTGDLN